MLLLGCFPQSCPVIVHSSLCSLLCHLLCYLVLVPLNDKEHGIAPTIFSRLSGPSSRRRGWEALNLHSQRGSSKELEGLHFLMLPNGTLPGSPTVDAPQPYFTGLYCGSVGLRLPKLLVPWYELESILLRSRMLPPLLSFDHVALAEEMRLSGKR